MTIVHFLDYCTKKQDSAPSAPEKAPGKESLFIPS